LIVTNLFLVFSGIVSVNQQIPAIFIFLIKSNISCPIQRNAILIFSIFFTASRDFAAV
jgi:hypothetical protein